MTTTHRQADSEVANPGGQSRQVVLLVSIASYLVGVLGLGALIFAYAGQFPIGQIFRLTDNNIIAALVNIGLLVLFGLQHSVMARKSYKAWSAKHIDPTLERSMYVLASGLAILIMLIFWQPMGGTVWQLTGKAAPLMWVAFVAGWAYLFAATFAIDHFDLFGLRQAWFAFRRQAYKEVPFKENWMYRYSRHPIMLGVIIGIWFVPQMTVTLLFLSIGLSIYILIGLYFEERDLIHQWGEQYLAYRKRVGALVTLPWTVKET